MPYAQLKRKVLEMVGSCSSLVAQQAFACMDRGQGDPLGADEAELLLSAILVDTVNLDLTAGRTTPLDTDMAARLLALCPGLSQDELYQSVQTAKADLAPLTLAQLLRKDFKSNGVLGIAAVPLPLAVLAERAALTATLEQFCRDRGLHVLILMTTLFDPQFARQLAVYTPPDAPPALHAAVVATLEAGQLELAPLDVPGIDSAVSCFSQGALKSSRKVIMPLLVDQFSQPLKG